MSFEEQVTRNRKADKKEERLAHKQFPTNKKTVLASQEKGIELQAILEPTLHQRVHLEHLGIRSRVAGDSGADPASGEVERSDTLNSKRSDTLEAAIMDLEEYVNKVKWLKKVLLTGISSSDDERPQWRFS